MFGIEIAVIGAYASAMAAKQQADAARRADVAGGQPAKSAEPSLAELTRAHNARMAAEHAETMRQARIGTWLLVAFVVAAGFAVANLLGGIG